MAREAFLGVSEISKAGKHRLQDVHALLKACRWRGAMYLAGYSTECLLKARLMRRFSCGRLDGLEQLLRRRGILPQVATLFTHNLYLLLALTESMDRLRQDRANWRSFNLVNRWMPAWRYTADPASQADARDFVEAVEILNGWIENNV